MPARAQWERMFVRDVVHWGLFYGLQRRVVLAGVARKKVIQKSCCVCLLTAPCFLLVFYGAVLD